MPFELWIGIHIIYSNFTTDKKIIAPLITNELPPNENNP